jgi:hypothetical protein
MNRRGFLTGLGAMVAGVALEQAIPLGRVWSFPKEIKIKRYDDFWVSGRWCIRPKSDFPVGRGYIQLTGLYYDYITVLLTR